MLLDLSYALLLRLTSLALRHHPLPRPFDRQARGTAAAAISRRQRPRKKENAGQPA
jgi:hypothetical protein